jgi:N-acetylmuramoyl-L-alanine amidase
MATIVIDPGHGGTQDLLGSSANNAVGPGGTLEKDLTLDVAGRVATRLQGAGHTVQLTRTQDVNIGAAERAEVGRRIGAHAFVSIHFNHSARPDAQGTEVLVRPASPSSIATLDEGSRRLAEAIRAELVPALQLADLGLHAGPWVVLSERLHDPGTARCIVEVAFLSDAREESRLADPAHRDAIADALARGIGHAVGADVVTAPQMRAAGGLGYRSPRPAARGPDSYGRVVRPRISPARRVAPRGLQAGTDWCLIRHNIIRSAVEMQGAWLDASYNLRQEGAADVLEYLQEMWRDGVQDGNWSTLANESASNVTPWSGAFVSWTVRNAGVTPAMGFAFSGRHMDYIGEALRNRMRNATNRPFWFFGIDEQAAHPLLPGDIVCMNRRVDGAMTNHSLANLTRRFWGENGENEGAATTGSSHCDVAVGYQDDPGGQRYIEVIGGNRGNRGGPSAHTVGTALIEVDAAGQIVDPAAHDIFGIVKLIECDHAL